MHRERQTILSLLALGRITPREAERLLAAWNAGREELWIFATCAAAGLAQCLSPLAHLAQSFSPMHHGLAAITYWMRGVL
jgi:hypothetical protein